MELQPEASGQPTAEAPADAAPSVEEWLSLATPQLAFMALFDFSALLEWFRLFAYILHRKCEGYAQLMLAQIYHWYAFTNGWIYNWYRFTVQSVKALFQQNPPPLKPPYQGASATARHRAVLLSFAVVLLFSACTKSECSAEIDLPRTWNARGQQTDRHASDGMKAEEEEVSPDHQWNPATDLTMSEEDLARKLDFWDTLDTLISSHSNADHLTVVGDFNARLAQEMDRDAPGLGPNVWGTRQALQDAEIASCCFSRGIKSHVRNIGSAVGVVGGSLFCNGSLKVFAAGGVSCSTANIMNEGESVGTSLPLPESLDERCTSQPSEHGPQETVLEESERARLHAAIGEAAMISGEHGSGLKLPWESGGFALIFGAQKTVDFEVPEVPFPVVAPGASQDTAEKLIHPAKRQKLEPCGAENFRRVINFKQAFDDETLDQNKWARALEKWYTILGENWASSLIGFKISKLPAEEGVKRIRELFGKKSVATVDRRANSLLGYISWGHKAHPGVDIFPLCTVCTWMLDEHLEWLQHNKTKVSAMHSFRESINFCHFVVGVEVSATCKSLWSPWAKGLLGMRDLERSERKQSAVLTVGQVAFLELLLDDDSVELMDRYAAGVMLFAVYSRSRCSDLKVVEGFILDTANVGGNQIGFIECKTRSHKSSRQVAQQGLAMPLIAPIMGVRNVSWGMKFIEVAKAVGLGLEGRAKGPMLPAPTEAGEWRKRAVTSGEMSRWLQVLLKDEGNSAEVSSHSLKSFGGGPTTAGTVASTRRLIFEAHTLLIADLKGRVEKGEDASVGSMSHAE
ncbi:hypothetical protein AK812_SmicGene30835, partial [Symbiodinium microadriaticum]